MDSTGRNQLPADLRRPVLAALLGIAVFVFFGWLSKLVIGRWHESTRKTRLTPIRPPPATTAIPTPA